MIETAWSIQNSTRRDPAHRRHNPTAHKSVRVPDTTDCARASSSDRFQNPESDVLGSVTGRHDADAKGHGSESLGWARIRQRADSKGQLCWVAVAQSLRVHVPQLAQPPDA